MAPTALNLTALVADLSGVVPTTGHNYQVVNQDNPEQSKQIWTYLTYPSGNGSAVFTLQAESTLQSKSSAVISGRGGYMRVDPTTNKLVHGG